MTAQDKAIDDGSESFRSFNIRLTGGHSDRTVLIADKASL